MTQLLPHVKREIVEHARAEAPRECCGMIGRYKRSDSELVKVYPAVNSAVADRNFGISGVEQYRIERELEDDGLRIGAIYHSHPTQPPSPSAADQRFMTYFPGVLSIIVSLAGDEPEIAIFGAENR